MDILASWDYLLWALVVLALLIYLVYVLLRAERF
jgi:K+-transporting ATPase KdpF subunit